MSLISQSPSCSQTMELISIIISILLVFLLFISMFRRNETRRKLPPGPHPLPLIGNLLELGDKPYESLANLAKTYGPIMSLKLGQKTFHVISSPTLAKETFRKQDLILSTRSIPNALHAYDHSNYSVVWMPVSDIWRKIRKIINIVLLQTNKLNASQKLRQEKVHELVAYVKKCSKEGVIVDIGHAAFKTSLNILSNIMFSKDLTDDLSKEFRDVIYDIQTNAGKPNLADLFPALQTIDPQGRRRELTHSLQKMVSLVRKFINERVESKRLKKDTDDNDVLESLLNMVGDINGTQIERLLADLFIAGMDSTASTVEWAMAELLRNSKVLKMAKSELEEKIGHGKPIEESDIARLPYLRAVVKETLRMHPPTPFNARIVGADVEISNYNIPKGAQFLMNFWAMCRDPGLWENPTLFEPERFMVSNTDVPVHDFEHIPFGFGRRSCPGISLASRTIHLMVGSLVNSFDWTFEGGIMPEELNMEEKFGGITILKSQPLRVVPISI